MWNTLLPEDSFGCLSLVPPLTAIAFAIATRRVVVSLLAGVFTGTLILSGGNPFAAVAAGLESHLWPSLADGDHLRVFVFTLLMGAMVGVMQRSGGMEAVVGGIAPLARGRRGGQTTVWLLGLLVFFDDYANSLLLGNTMRPLADRLRISREKLAYLVDSTAAPVSGLALVSTWVAGEIGYIQDGLDASQLVAPVGAFEIFLTTIPYRFYVLFALLFVPLVGLLGRDFGPMLTAERRAINAEPVRAADDSRHERQSGRWLCAVIPVVVVVTVTMILIAATGRQSLLDSGEAATTLRDIFGNGDSYLALVYGSLSGFAVACILARVVGRNEVGDIKQGAAAGAVQVLPALVILWLAWSLSGLTTADYLGTGEYLGLLLSGSMDVRWMPTVVFVLASAVAFSTGTSWGTMGILMPLVVPVTVELLGATVAPEHPLLVASIAGVLAGAIFGDHCSPISDTTVLSSQAAGCDHIAHVRTQMPYALLVGTISIVCGTIPVGFGFSVAVCLSIGTVLCLASIVALGRPAESINV